ncbi:MAG: hypothetical protein ACD_61C00106G0003 [uncultured bacterium]|nr:MAG: hypothetical protein ACD_61C00106G0003 [uncultured bacterium]
MLVLVAIIVIAILMLMEPFWQAVGVFVASLSTNTIFWIIALPILIIMIVVEWKRHHPNRN